MTWLPSITIGEHFEDLIAFPRCGNPANLKIECAYVLLLGSRAHLVVGIHNLVCKEGHCNGGASGS